MTERKRRLQRKLEVLAQGPYSLLTAPSPQPGLYKWPVGEPPGYAIPKVPDADPGDNIVAGKGVYASCQLSSATKTELFAWARKCGIPEKYLEDRAEYHITTVYSKEPFSGYRPLQLHEPKRIGKGKRTVERFGDAVVVTLTSSTLQKQWEQARAKGASWDFPSYRAHITIAKEVPPKFKVEKIPPYSGVIEIVSEKVEPLDESKGDDSDKEKEESMLKIANRLEALANEIEQDDDRELKAQAANRAQINQSIRSLRERLGQFKKKEGDPAAWKKMRREAEAMGKKPKPSDEEDGCGESMKKETALFPNMGSGHSIRESENKKVLSRMRKARKARSAAKKATFNPTESASKFFTAKGMKVTSVRKGANHHIMHVHEGDTPHATVHALRASNGFWSYNIRPHGDTKKPKYGTALHRAHFGFTAAKNKNAPAKKVPLPKKKKAKKATTPKKPMKRKKIVRKPKIDVLKRFAKKASKAAKGRKKEEAIINAAIVGGALKAKRALGGKPKPEKPYYPNPGQGRVVHHPKHGRGFVQEHRANGKSTVSFDKDMKGAALRGQREVDTKDLKYGDN